MQIFQLSPGAMLLAGIPHLLLIVAAICWLRAIKSSKHGADINSQVARKWLRLLSAVVYLTIFEIVLLNIPFFGWVALFLIVPFILLFVLATIWLLYPKRFTRPGDKTVAAADKGRRQKFDEFFWRRTPVKRWFVSGPKLPLIRVIRRSLAVFLMFLLLAFAAFAKDDTQGTQAGASSASTTDDRTPAAIADQSSTAPKNVGDKPSASPKSTPSATKTEKPVDCGAPSMATDDTDSKLTTKYIEVCKDGAWKKWSAVYPDTNGPVVKVVFKEWVSMGEYGYGRITFGADTKSTVLVRFKTSNI